MTTRVLMLFLACVVLYSCGSTLQTFEEALNSEIESTPIIPLAVDGIKDELDSDLLDNKFIVEYGSLENPLYNDKLDSIYEVLKNEKSILLDLADKQLYLDLLSRYNADTTYLTNIYMKTPKGGLPVTYVYDVKKNDLVFYTIENLGKNNIEEVSILEGATYRYVKQNLLKKKKETGTIKIINDNSLSLYISNDTFLKNKGLMSSKVKIQLKKISPLKINYEVVTDSILEVNSLVDTVYDTIYKSKFDTSVKLFPTLNITEQSKLVVPVDVDLTENELVGWGYWVGLNRFNSIIWETDQENDMINFARQEFFGFDNDVLLQTSENENIKLKINDLSLDTRSLNYNVNYAFYKADSKIQKSERRAEIVIRNLSYIYEYKLQLALVSVFLKERQVLVDKEIFIKKKFIKLTMNDDE
tara:strand:+ start:2289 stop:3530 length:1242 start_codon:yes stop_codon:yes gene_type:complete